jgi:hypothetical protein
MLLLGRSTSFPRMGAETNDQTARLQGSVVRRARPGTVEDTNDATGTDADGGSPRSCDAAKKPKLNGELMTEEEMNLPMGLGFTSAARRLNLIYLASPEAMLTLLLQFGGEAWEFSQSHRMNKRQFWKTMNEKAERLAIIVQGGDPAYMAIPWFTNPSQLAASLRRQLEQERPSDSPGAGWRKHPIRACARSFMEFFLELWEGGIGGQGSIPNEQLMSAHIRRYAGMFLGMDPANLKLELSISDGEDDGN